MHNFARSELLSDAGLPLVKEFAYKLGFAKILKANFKTVIFRLHKDDENLQQMVYQILGTYFEDNCADELTNDPVLTAILGKKALASQSTLSRFFHRIDNSTLRQFYDIMRKFHKTIYAINDSQMLLLDLDYTLLDTYGLQKGAGFNSHYHNHGYHPLVCCDEISRDLLKIQLRNVTDYSYTGVVDFLQSLLDEFLTDYPKIPLLLRGDSVFAISALYMQCEKNSTSYVIRLKENLILRVLSSDITMPVSCHI